jgi:hypothetical protein
MPLDDDTITTQLDLLATHRRTLTHLLTQAAQYGGAVFAPPQTTNGITEARAEIGRIKQVLRTGGVVVEHEPNDIAPSRAEPVQSQLGGGHLSLQGSIGQASGPVSQNFGEQTTINTGGGNAIDSGGGDVAGGNIDKRQGEVFVENSTVFNQPGWSVGGNVYNVAGDLQVGDTSVSLPPALHQPRAPIGDFVGREQEIDKLVQILSTAGGAAAAISGVRGMGGIGKTELAYAVAQRLAVQFPDAQLLIELRGASSSPLAPSRHSRLSSAPSSARPSSPTTSASSRASMARC